MNASELGVNLFVTLFALLDPIGNLPIFAAATVGASLRQRASVSFFICAFAFLFLLFSLFRYDIFGKKRVEDPKNT